MKKTKPYCRERPELPSGNLPRPFGPTLWSTPTHHLVNTIHIHNSSCCCCVEDLYMVPEQPSPRYGGKGNKTGKTVKEKIAGTYEEFPFKLFLKLRHTAFGFSSPMIDLDPCTLEWLERSSKPHTTLFGAKAIKIPANKWVDKIALLYKESPETVAGYLKGQWAGGAFYEWVRHDAKQERCPEGEYLIKTEDHPRAPLGKWAGAVTGKLLMRARSGGDRCGCKYKEFEIQCEAVWPFDKDGNTFDQTTGRTRTKKMKCATRFS